MRPELLERAREIADRLPLHMTKYNVDRLRATFAYDLAVAFEQVYKNGVADALLMNREKAEKGG